MGKKAFYYIVGRDSCPWCVKAKDLLDDVGAECIFRDLGTEQQLMMEYTKKYNWDTVPMVFHFDSDGNHSFVGGYDNLINHLDIFEE